LTSTTRIKMYYSIGNGYYINAKNVGLPNGPVNLTIDHNSYVYNYKGQRKKAKTIKRIPL
ncbi:SLAP domain-containing protein, partial [Lactobacillus helveticus]|uniref:SLAP domain-containing protein n=2 Tax=Lactobacillus helveticus TaxID=1587 RepID=UPI0015677858